jgi:hypothetical protein
MARRDIRRAAELGCCRELADNPSALRDLCHPAGRLRRIKGRFLVSRTT